MPGNTVLDDVTRNRLLGLLASARELVQGDLAASAAPLEAVLSEAGDQVAALRMVQELKGSGVRSQAESAAGRLAMTGGARDESVPGGACSVLSAGGEPVTEFRLIPFGVVRVERPLAGADFTFGRRHATELLRWFESIGRKLAIDYEHQSLERVSPRSDGLRPAAGWISRLEVREDGLWAVDVEWTERARALLRSGEYRYFSPVIFWEDESREAVAGLGPVALTNDPAMCGVVALAAARRRGLDAEPDAAGEIEQAGTSSATLAERLESAEAEVQVLRDQLARQAADAFVEEGLRLGKIVDATSLDWRDEYLRDPSAAVARLTRAPVVLPPGRIGAGRDEQAGNRRERGGAATEDVLGIDAADLAAYERAQAAGRIAGI